jgi:sigma-B regulation protein RsbU (phosphoserine phosphatase)
VGGDFYDVLPLADGRLIVTIGDVAGKGSPAALLMALLLAVLRTLVEDDLPPTELMRRLNIQISRHSPRSRFITLFLGIYSPSTGELVYVNAGQNPPLLRRRDGSYERLEGTGVALGMFEAATYSSAATVLGPDEMLVLYSDGVTEAEDPKGQPFDEYGLQGTITTYAAYSAAEIGVEVLRAVEQHAREPRFADDLTLLIVKRSSALRPSDAASRP